jgi:hypothetical protein
MSDEKVTKHHTLATTGTFNGMSKGGHAKKHPSHGGKSVHHFGHHEKHGHGSHKGLHEAVHESGQTDDIGTDGKHDSGGKHGFSGGSTGGTRNRI